MFCRRGTATSAPSNRSGSNVADEVLGQVVTMLMNELGTHTRGPPPSTSTVPTSAPAPAPSPASTPPASAPASTPAGTACYTLDAYVEDRPMSYLAIFDVPGVPRADITVDSPDHHTLVVSATRRSVRADRQAADQPQEFEVLRSELRQGIFTRGMRFRHAIQPSGMRARLENGVLRLTIPKAEGPALASLWE